MPNEPQCHARLNDGRVLDGDIVLISGGQHRSSILQTCTKVCSGSCGECGVTQECLSHGTEIRRERAAGEIEREGAREREGGEERGGGQGEGDSECIRAAYGRKAISIESFAHGFPKGHTHLDELLEGF